MNLRVVSPVGGGRSRRPHKIDEDVGRLFDHIVDHPEGMTYRDALAWGWPRTYFIRVVNAFRRTFKDEDVVLVCSQPGPKEPWIYTLSGETRAWTAGRLDYAETALETIQNVASSASKMHDGRSKEGRRARLIERSVRHLIEDLADLREEAAG